jgi:hypothetical protein
MLRWLEVVHKEAKISIRGYFNHSRKSTWKKDGVGFFGAMAPIAFGLDLFYYY